MHEERTSERKERTYRFSFNEPNVLLESYVERPSAAPEILIGGAHVRTPPAHSIPPAHVCTLPAHSTTPLTAHARRSTTALLPRVFHHRGRTFSLADTLFSTTSDARSHCVLTQLGVRQLAFVSGCRTLLSAMCTAEVACSPAATWTPRGCTFFEA
ncbi:hypothetical protein LR48_Vigan09g178000 [Vigna angularis]|uniref:Uncharacterized protein n=1 Tax=Phaseolus angularis TaxID=3914 RepID=A0A0L9VDI2_PHAAN|nr:hypothetical protein LR48_Vigan09g178000 [Vigna angularis]